MHRPILFISILVLVAFSVIGQAPGLYFSKLSTENGLSHNQVNCILQDRRGFLWFGTEDGLNRFDGKHFAVFRNQPQNPSSLSGNRITSLLEDADGILWIATANAGISRYDYRQPPALQFKQYRHRPSDSTSIPVNTVYDLVEDGSGYLWLASAGRSVLRFNKKKEVFEEPVPEGTRTALALAIDGGGTLWVGRQGGGLLRVNTRTLQYNMEPKYADLYANLPHAAITSIYRDRHNNMWFGSWDNVLYCQPANQMNEQAFSGGPGQGGYRNDEALAFAEDRNGLLWIAGKNEGLQLYDAGRKKFYAYRHQPALAGSISSNRVLALYSDRNGRMWVGTDKGVCLFDPGQRAFAQQFLFAPGDMRNNHLQIFDFYEDAGGNEYIGSSQGLFIRQAGHSDFRHLALRFEGHPLSVTCFFADSDGTLYLGTDFTLFKYDPRQQRVVPLENYRNDKVMGRIIDSRIVSIIKDSIAKHPVLLVSPYGHYLAYYDLHDRKWVSRLDSQVNPVQTFNLADNLVRRVYKSPSGRIWLATVKQGLGSWQKDEPFPRVAFYQSHPGQPETLGNDDVFDIVETREGNLWVSTYGAGLYFYNVQTGLFRHIPQSPNLLEGLALDDRGRVWMLGNGQLHCYDHRSGSFYSLGLPDMENSGGIRGYLHRLPSGEMLAAGAGYFINFHPDSVNLFQSASPVLFTDFKVFNQSQNQLLFRQPIKLDADQNYFTVEFASPDFSEPGVHYWYRLEGWDKGWIDAGASNMAQYSNLPGGSYSFRVRVSNRPGETQAILPITIIPPVTQRWWFFALSGTCLALLIFGAYRYRINELLKRQAIRNKIAQDLHDNVGSTLSSISVYSQVAKIYRQKNKSDELQHALDKISSISGEMISEMNDIVWAINPRNDNMATILQRMESYARPLLAARDILFHFHAEASLSNLNLEMTRRKNFYLIFKEAVNNALKYSECQNLTVQIMSEHQHITMLVSDDGQGFDSSLVSGNRKLSLSGNGLNNMKMRAQEMKGKCEIESRPGLGTSISLRFPVT